MSRNFFKDLFDEFAEIRFAAASLAFSSLISLIPFLIIVLAVLQSIGGLDRFYPQIENLMINYLKEATGLTVSQYVKKSLSGFQPKALGATGGLLLLWASLGLIRNIDMAFHRIWKIKVTSPIYSRIWLYWMILVIIPLVLALFTGLQSQSNLNFIRISLNPDFVVSLWSSAFLVFLYKVIPSTKVNWTSALVPAVLAGFALTVIQNGFLSVSYRVFKQNKIYGSLASVPIFLVWLLVVWYIVLSGVALSSFLQKREKLSKSLN